MISLGIELLSKMSWPQAIRLPFPLVILSSKALFLVSLQGQEDPRLLGDWPQQGEIYTVSENVKGIKDDTVDDPDKEIIIPLNFNITNYGFSPLRSFDGAGLMKRGAVELENSGTSLKYTPYKNQVGTDKFFLY